MKSDQKCLLTKRCLYKAMILISEQLLMTTLGVETDCVVLSFSTLQTDKSHNLHENHVTVTRPSSQAKGTTKSTSFLMQVRNEVDLHQAFS